MALVVLSCACKHTDCKNHCYVPISILSALTILSLSTQGVPIKIRAKISVLKGPGWCTQNGQTVESMHSINALFVTAAILAT